MFIYNVTVKIASAIHPDWVEWMLSKHIPDVMDSGCFTKYQFVKLLEVDDEEGPTYAAQYYAASKADYDTYINEFAPALRQDAFNMWGNNFTGFRTLMQVVG